MSQENIFSKERRVTDRVIIAFGGISATARALGHKYPTTVGAWKETGRIPSWRRAEIIAAASREGIELPHEFLEAA